jgi:hypothetical protein
MARNIHSVDEFRSYLSGVMERANHHGQNVNAVLLSLAGAVALFKDPHVPLEVKTRDGDTKNILWASIRGTRYAFCYNHHDQSVEIRLENFRGPVQHTFTNHTPPGEVLAVMQAL